MDTKAAENAIELACKDWSIVLKEKQLEAIMDIWYLLFQLC